MVNGELRSRAPDAPQNHPLTFGRAGLGQARGEFFNNIGRKIEAGEFPAVPFEMKIDSSGCFVIANTDREFDGL